MFAPDSEGNARSLDGINVVVASRIYLPEPGAASLRLAALSRALRDEGALITVLTSTSPKEYGNEVSDHSGISVKRRKVLRDRLGYVRGYLQYLSFDIPLFARLLFSRRIDVVVVEPPPTTGVVVRFLCTVRRIPYLYYAADLWSDAVESTGSPRLVARVVRAMERFVVRGAAAVLSVSPSVSDRVSELERSVVPVTVGNGVDTTVFSLEGEAHSAEPRYLLYAGTSSEVHGATVFMDAFKLVLDQVASARLIFVGQGAERHALEEAAAGLPAGAVTFVPRVSPDEAARWIRGARATLASVRPGAYAIGFPTKIYASVACGVPVIYSGTGVGREFAEKHDIGWAVEYSPTHVADAMLEAFDGRFREANRERLAQLAVAEVSLSAVASRAARAVATVVNNFQRKGGAR